MNDRELLEAAMGLAYHYGRYFGELEQINKQIDAERYNLECKIESLKTENAALRKKYEKVENERT